MEKTLLFLSPNTGATNETGFTALPGGQRNFYGTFLYIGDRGHWWSSTDIRQFDHYDVWYREMLYNNNRVGRISYNLEGLGLSVRCLKD